MPVVTKLIGMLVVISFTSGCALMADIGKESKRQSLTVVTPLAVGAECEITDVVGHKYKVKSTPSVVVVRQGFSPLTFICKKSGYKTEIAYLDDDRIAQSTMNLPDELGGLLDNPRARVATEFPREIAVWLQPVQWKSEKHMQDWAFEKSLYDHKLYLLEEKKLKAYQRMEEQRMFFKTWANNQYDKTRTTNVDEYYAHYKDSLPANQVVDDNTRSASEGFIARFKDVIRSLLPVDTYNNKPSTPPYTIISNDSAVEQPSDNKNASEKMLDDEMYFPSTLRGGSELEKSQENSKHLPKVIQPQSVFPKKIQKNDLQIPGASEVDANSNIMEEDEMDFPDRINIEEKDSKYLW